MQPLSRSFYERPTVTVAKDLLGCVLVCENDDRLLTGRIVETEAYCGEEDQACHARAGRTKRTETMYGPAGHAYVYLIYGMYDMLNVVTVKGGAPEAVLIRSATPLQGVNNACNGPGKLTRAFGITRAHNQWDVTRGERLWIAQGTSPQTIEAGPRIGVEYADAWADKPWRFSAVLQSAPREHSQVSNNFV